MKLNPLLHKAQWLASGDVRPYVFVRPENSIANPGIRHSIDWFGHEPITKNPLSLKESNFAEMIYTLEDRAFGPKNMAMPRWVFYDCSIVPGFVAGFAGRASKMPKEILDLFPEKIREEWVPLSLFIIIPSMHRGEWVAHNLCTMNNMVSKQNSFYALGFLSKAFGLWYANVEQCTGFTQWDSPAIKLHSHYGHIEILGAYAPIHSYAQTLTYRAHVQTSCWEKFFKREVDLAFLENYSLTSLHVDPKSEATMIDIQQRIEAGEGPFYLNAAQVAKRELTDVLDVYKPKANYG